MLADLAAGRIEPDAADRWAMQWVAADDSGVDDVVVWSALTRLAGCDLPSVDGSPLFGPLDFERWLVEYHEKMEHETTEPTLPAFLAPPRDAPPYYGGFPVLENVTSDGFRLGIITDSMREFARHGDAFLIAPDGSRAGLAWAIGEQTHFQLILAPDELRWGVYAVWTRHAPTSVPDARQFLSEVVDMLRPEWERTRAGR